MIRENPDDCRPGDLVPKETVADWPPMSGASVIAFRRFVGVRGVDRAGQLYRKGPLIFQVSDSPYARCMYNHTREF